MVVGQSPFGKVATELNRSSWRANPAEILALGGAMILGPNQQVRQPAFQAGIRVDISGADGREM